MKSSLNSALHASKNVMDGSTHVLQYGKKIIIYTNIKKCGF